MSEHDWEKRAKEILQGLWRNGHTHHGAWIEAALQLGREMSDARAEDFERDMVAISPYEHGPIARACAAIARSFISKSKPDPLGMQKTGVDMETEARIRADERENVFARLEKLGYEGAAERMRREFAPPKPKTREQILEEALRELEEEYFANEGDEYTVKRIARNALEWTSSDTSPEADKETR
jgi:hypothetical protein